MPGHIKLGYAGALRDYNLVKPESRNKNLANPMAAKLGMGLGSYDDMQNWAGFLMEDWQGGIGKKDVGAGPLYSSLETRYPNRLLLSYAAIQPDQTYTENYQNQPGIAHPQAEISVGASSAIKRISQKVKSYGGYNENQIVYLKNEGKQVTIESYADSAGKPTGAALSAVNITTNDYGNGVGYSPYLVLVDPNKPAGTAYHIVIYPTGSDTISVPVCATNSATNTYNGSTWSTYSTYSLMVANLNQTGLADVTGKGVIFSNIYYFARATELVKFTGTGFTVVHTFANSISDICSTGDTLYIGFSGSATMYTMNAAEVFTADGGGNQANLFASWNGYLWRSLNENVYYTGDGSTWTTVEVGFPGDAVTSMAGAGDYLYVSTETALYYVGSGDQVLNVTNRPAVLHSYQDALYAAMGRSLVKYDAGTILPMGPDLGEGLPALRDGSIVAMAHSNYWLFIAVQAYTANARSTIWAWNGQGWQHICTLPGGDNSAGGTGYFVRGLCYDHTNECLWANDGGLPLKISLPDVANYNANKTVVYMPQGWLETDWYFGGLFEIAKDVESVYISADVCDSNRYIEVYWKDDASTAWELLGTVTSTRQELRWSNPATRPNTRQIKLGFALYSKTVNTSPIVRAIRLKYMPMILDRWRWMLPIEVSDNQQFPGGGINPYNAYQQKQHLETLIKGVPPVIFQDVDGTQYEVKILSAGESISRWELIDSAPAMTLTYSLTVEQATASTYSG